MAMGGLEPKSEDEEEGRFVANARVGKVVK